MGGTPVAPQVRLKAQPAASSFFAKIPSRFWPRVLLPYRELGVFFFGNSDSNSLRRRNRRGAAETPPVRAFASA